MVIPAKIKKAKIMGSAFPARHAPQQTVVGRDMYALAKPTPLLLVWISENADKMSKKVQKNVAFCTPLTKVTTPTITQATNLRAFGNVANAINTIVNATKSLQHRIGYLKITAAPTSGFAFAKTMTSVDAKPCPEKKNANKK